MSQRTTLAALVFLAPALLLACGGESGGGRGNELAPGGKPTGTGPGGGPPVATGPGMNGNPTPPIVLITCGDGKVGQGEFCDDGNKDAGDGCSTACGIEDGWSCPPTGGACSNTAACGDGKLRAAEACDDGNNTDGDGCSADCSAVTPGWQCRVPGKKCVPLCGDGVITGSENCDDGNAVSGDGCSSTCLTEPGASCPTAGMPCSKAECGNSVAEVGETCDKGPENGLFYGDATGCSKTCTAEPTCRDAMGVTQACSTFCGDGNIDNGEACDDGNQNDNDGCSKTCQEEPGFTCTAEARPDTVDCPSSPGTQCLVLPVIFRDFEGQNVSGGHPDFFYLGQPATGGRTTGVIGGKTACVPNASGMKAAWAPGDACTNTDAVGPCQGVASATLNAQGKPGLAKDTCPCVFTDWDQTGVLTGVAGAQMCWVMDEGSMRTRIDSMVKVVQSAESFAQWYTASTMSTEVKGTLELANIGTQFQFSSSIPGAAAGAPARTVYEDLHDNCLGTATPLQSGFFPLEAAAGSKLCNLWPYWATGLSTTSCTAGAGNPIISQWDPLASYDNCPTAGTGGPVPRSDGTGTAVRGVPRNFYFTTEARYLFRYSGPATLAFYGDDDVWVYVNGRMALDLGAPHERLQGMVAINETFGLEMGKIYEIAVFHADRHPRESNYQLTLSGFATQRSVCSPRCGDGTTTATEECDDGEANMDGVYGGCTSECKFGPFCGDGMTDASGGEQCDLGRMNGAVYGSRDGCTSACQTPLFCGDGIISTEFREGCDDGVNNGTPGSVCTAACTIVAQ